MTAAQVQFLGSGDAFGSGGRFQTCITVEHEHGRFLLDCGASSLVAMKRYGVDPAGIDTILVTHLHGDHFGGLPFFILDAQFSRRSQPLLLAGPPGLEARIRAAMEVFFPGSSQTPQRFPIEFVELSPGVATQLGTITVTPYLVTHASGAPAYALRAELDGKAICYSGDTEWTETLIPAATGTDLFICEAYFFDKQVKYHLDYQTLMRHRSALGCRRMILTHMSADMLGHLQDLQCEVAEDGLCISL